MQELSKNSAICLNEIHVKHDKKNTALLLLHGFGSSPAVYRECLPTLANYYDTIICPQLPGHASSIQDFAKVRATDWQQMTCTLCSYLINSHNHVDVMGLSLGGILAYQVSRIFKLRHLYLLAPAFRLRINLQRALAAAYILRGLGIKTIANRGGDLYCKQHYELTYKRLPISTIIEILRFIQQQPRPHVKCPTTIFLGTHDNVVDSKAIYNLFITQANTTINWLTNSAHILPLDSDRHIITATLANLAPTHYNP